MGGICGIWDGSGQGVNPSDLEQMMERLAHRGPDGQRLWSEGEVGFGHLMLWTTPESHQEILPWQQEDLVLTADARLDNREILAEQLEISPPQLSDLPDSQLILRAYQRWGTACAEQLLGDFSFAIWDGHHRRLVCVRDHLGIKPFYYYRSGPYFAFASQIRALLPLPRVPCQINYPHIQSLYNNQLDPHQTFYHQIYRLPPASVLEISPAGPRLSSYWSLDPERELQLGSDQEYTEAFRELFFQSVQCRLRSAYPIGSHLSGGLDSSSIVCVARQLLGQQGRDPLHTFSSVFTQVKPADERIYMAAVLRQGELHPHLFLPEESGPLPFLATYQRHEDEGHVDANHYLIWAHSQQAQQAGVRVMLDGFDGDTVVSHGSDHLIELLQAERWPELQAEIEGIQTESGVGVERALAQGRILGYLQYLARSGRLVELFQKVKWIESTFKIPARHLFLQHGLKPLLPMAVVRMWRSLKRLPPPDPKHHPTLQEKHFFDATFAAQSGLTDIFASERKAASLQPTSVRQLQYQVLTSGLFSFSLEVIDRTAARHHLEARHPFLDKRLVEFCLSLPSDQKQHHGWGRIVLRRAMQGILPQEIQWRPSKANFSPSFAYGLLQINGKALHELLFDESQPFHTYVNTPRLQALYRKATRADGADLRDSTNALAIWRTISLAQWLSSAVPAVPADAEP